MYRISNRVGETFAFQPWADRLGIWASVLCVIHCVFTPVLLSTSIVFAHLLPGDEVVHRTLAVLIALLGAIALVRGFSQHREMAVLVLMCIGLGCIFGTAWFGDDLPSHIWEVGITMIGSGFMIAAHRRNHRSCKACAESRCVG